MMSAVGRRSALQEVEAHRKLSSAAKWLSAVAGKAGKSTFAGAAASATCGFVVQAATLGFVAVAVSSESSAVKQIAAVPRSCH
ncbi:hypothetical protein OGATHE_001110 [Ogataea polymorpha]|uniref:Uncharacterized protein n=1 Tax=Ogataea polymorpha TaxID=460523 RepID=A0A9P8TF59_9ASCO|nr:hypothetical protein OGATHE_001110 [Ogataea polymorpha]